MSEQENQKILHLFDDILSQKTDEKLRAQLLEADSKGDDVDLVNFQKALQLDMRLGERNLFFLKKVAQAKKKVLEGTYGTCEDCASEISSERLKARPTAALCISCQEEKENEQFNSIHFRRDLKKLGIKKSGNCAGEKKYDSMKDIGFESVVDF